MSYDYLFKIIFVGDACVGKTALAERITKNEFHESYNSTIGVDFSTVTLDIGDQTIKTHIWDTAGQKCFASIISTYYRGIAGAVIVFDVSSRNSFRKCSFWLNQIKQNGTIGHLPVIALVGNKIDRAIRDVTYDEAVNFAEKNNMNYYETSARKNIDVMKFYKGLIEKIYNTADLDAEDEKHGIRKGMVSHSKVQIKDERECCFDCCTTH
jgi:small GTP-binding protein